MVSLPTVQIHQLNFTAAQVVGYWQRPESTNVRLASRTDTTYRINHVKTTDGGGAVELGLHESAQRVTETLRSYLQSVVDDFQSSWTPNEYLAANR